MKNIITTFNFIIKYLLKFKTLIPFLLINILILFDFKKLRHFNDKNHSN